MMMSRRLTLMQNGVKTMRWITATSSVRSSSCIYAAPALVSVAYAALVVTKTVGFSSLLVAECRDAVCVGCILWLLWSFTEEVLVGVSL